MDLAPSRKEKTATKLDRHLNDLNRLVSSNVPKNYPRTKVRVTFSQCIHLTLMTMRSSRQSIAMVR